MSKLPALVLGLALFGMLLGTLPSVSDAQTVLKSTNYALDSINFGSSFDLTSAKDLVPPSITQGPQITSLSSDRITVVWQTDRPSSSSVEYGLTLPYNQETKDQGSVITHTITVIGLTPQTAYHYRVKSTDPTGAIGYSRDATFTTPQENGINSIKVTDVTYTTALLSWQTGNATSEQINYGTNTSYGQTVQSSANSFTTTHTVKLDGLQDGTDYHFQIIATASDGTVLKSSDLSFSTIAEPRFVSVSSTSDSANQATLKWQTNTNTSAIVTYKSEGQIGDISLKTAGDSDYKQIHQLVIKDLIGQTKYHYEIVATDQQGKQISTGQKELTSSSDTAPPVVTNLNVLVTRSGDELVLTANWQTDEPAIATMSYGPKDQGDSGSVQASGSTSYVTDHTIVTTGLLPSTAYTLTAVSTDPFNNRSEAQISFATPRLTKTIFALIADAFSQSLGWLSYLLPKGS